MKFFQARILEWVAFPSPGDLSDSGADPVFLASPHFVAGGFFATKLPGKTRASWLCPKALLSNLQLVLESEIAEQRPVGDGCLPCSARWPGACRNPPGS